MLVTTSSMRYGFWPAMLPSIGICVANLAWVALAASGASALAHAFPSAFAALKLAGIGYIFWIAWRMAYSWASASSASRSRFPSSSPS
jgi:homoserine/homoserine lactone efflux protein